MNSFFVFLVLTSLLLASIYDPSATKGLKNYLRSLVTGEENLQLEVVEKFLGCGADPTDGIYIANSRFDGFLGIFELLPEMLSGQSEGIDDLLSMFERKLSTRTILEGLICEESTPQVLSKVIEFYCKDQIALQTALRVASNCFRGIDKNPKLYELINVLLDSELIQADTLIINRLLSVNSKDLALRLYMKDMELSAESSLEFGLSDKNLCFFGLALNGIPIEELEAKFKPDCDALRPIAVMITSTTMKFEESQLLKIFDYIYSNSSGLDGIKDFIRYLQFSKISEPVLFLKWGFERSNEGPKSLLQCICEMNDRSKAPSVAEYLVSVGVRRGDWQLLANRFMRMSFEKAEARQKFLLLLAKDSNFADLPKELLLLITTFYLSNLNF